MNSNTANLNQNILVNTPIKATVRVNLAHTQKVYSICA